MECMRENSLVLLLRSKDPATNFATVIISWSRRSAGNLNRYNCYNFRIIFHCAKIDGAVQTPRERWKLFIALALRVKLCKTKASTCFDRLDMSRLRRRRVLSTNNGMLHIAICRFSTFIRSVITLNLLRKRTINHFNIEEIMRPANPRK